ncbi:uncharacterized protein E0L32_007317 [Thyridium curvatum]|uniref:Mannan endo-1,6-alpha-mannosidase n=1 Tax=Thyridium curvatum TaxID=1093900 RepID=A0A507AZY5_9PEZI|nr:uncharacterized protein E0L32_007317 [Thyridium curvatum]TPX12014.1 hypothetical protein E0L32_007317 [Thyridium curvatum]
MVNLRAVGSFATRAALLASSQLSERADRATYTQNSVDAIKALQTWYDSGTGLWTSTGWWNGGNCLTVLADFSALNANEANKLNLGGVFANTFQNAQRSTAMAVVKTMSPSGLMTSSYSAIAARDLAERGFAGFINDYYDDEGWWALGLIRAYDVTGENAYLQMAESIFEDMKGGTDNTCGGGIWWSKEKKYKNAIANELYLSVAASLANRASNKQYYKDIATQQWAWFKGSGMINSNNRINDGLNIGSDGKCTNNGQNEWTYNQGVVLGGLVELYRAGGGADLLAQAKTIARAAISKLSQDGILHESCEPNCGADGAQFKGIFMRNLHYLQSTSPESDFKTFIMANADSIWSKDRADGNKLGLVWSGPPSAENGPTAGTHSSAMDALVAAVAAA